MNNENNAYIWPNGGGLAAKLWGSLLLFIGIMTFYVSRSAADEVLGGTLLMLLLGGLGIGLIGVKRTYTADTQERRFKLTATFFWYVMKQESWAFESFSQVKVDTVTGVKGSYMSRTRLIPKAGGEPMDIYVANGRRISDDQLAKARKLADAMGLPFVSAQ